MDYFFQIDILTILRNKLNKLIENLDDNIVYYLNLIIKWLS